MTIGDLLAALRRFRVPALGVFLLIFGIGLGSVFVEPNRYESDGVVVVAPKGADIGFEAQQTVQFVIPPIVKRLESAAFEQTVRDRLDPRLRDARIDISAESDPGTSVINLSAESSSPAAALNAAQVAVARLMQEPRSDAVTVDLVSPAAAATSVKAARAPRILGGTFLLGLIAAVLFAAVAHRLRPVLPRAEHFRERYGHEVLGEIPNAGRETGHAPAQTFNGTASPEIVEAFRSLEARVAMRITRATSELNRAIAVTSWGDHDGKSTVATSLAWMLATRGRRVTLVDCDMRRPSAHTLLEVPLEPGVADIAEGGGQVLSRCHETAIRTLDVIPAGKPERHPAEVLQVALPRLFAALQNRTVIVDTPPMFTAEATEIVSEADFVVLVADYRTRTPDEMQEAIAQLELSGTPILGVVLNRMTERDTAGHESYAYRAEPGPTPAAKPPEPRA